MRDLDALVPPIAELAREVGIFQLSEWRRRPAGRPGAAAELRSLIAPLSALQGCRSMRPIPST